MHEYECLGCGKKYYYEESYSKLLHGRICKECGDFVFYSITELEQHKSDLKWINKEYDALEKFIIQIQNDKENKGVFEYECLDCGRKYLTYLRYSKINNKRCPECGGAIFYSVNELAKHFEEKDWLKELNKEYSELEKTLYTEEKRKFKRNRLNEQFGWSL